MTRQPYILRDGDPAMLKRLHELLDALDKAKPWSVIVEPWKKKRSLSQNALYWRWVHEIAERTGNDNDTVHEFMKNKFCPVTVVAIGGESVAIRTTTKFATEDMRIYMDRVYAFAQTDLGILLPLPEEQHMSAA